MVVTIILTYISLTFFLFSLFLTCAAPETPIWHQNQCIPLNQCTKSKEFKSVGGQTTPPKDKSLWEGIVGFILGSDTSSGICTLGPHGKPCENGGTPTGTLGSCQCNCQKLTAGPNCEITIAIGRPYTKHTQGSSSSSSSTSQQVSHRKNCSFNDVICRKEWSTLNSSSLFTLQDIDSTLPTTTTTLNKLTLLNIKMKRLRYAIHEYAEQGIAEHTSIASFGRVLLQLMSVGAPAHLITFTISAAHDEIRHTKLCFQIVDTFTKTLQQYKHQKEQIMVTPPVIDDDDDDDAFVVQRPSIFPFPNDGMVFVTSNKSTLVLETLKDGVLGEATAAVRLCVRTHKNGIHPAIKTILEEIAIDEGTHSSLAWQTIYWAIQQNTNAHRTALKQLSHWKSQNKEKKMEEKEASALALDSTLNRFGLLTESEVLWISEEVRRSVVLPWLHAMLNNSQTHQTWNDFVHRANTISSENQDDVDLNNSDMSTVVATCVQNILVRTL